MDGFQKFFAGVQRLAPSRPRPANRAGDTGATNYAEAMTPNRWGAYDDAWTASRRDLFYGREIMLPYHAPPVASFAQGYDSTIGAALFDPYGAASRPRPKSLVQPGGETYYGFLAFGTDAHQNNASYAATPLGYQRPLIPVDMYFYQGALPTEAQPSVNEPPPWERQGAY